MHKVDIPIEEFAKKFKQEYSFLYEANGYVAGYNEAVAEGDEFIARHGDFVGEFARYRGDVLSSDREVAAFMFTLDSFGVL